MRRGFGLIALAACVVVAAACDSRSRPGGPGGVVVPSRDAAAGGRGDAVTDPRGDASAGGSEDAGVAVDPRLDAASAVDGASEPDGAVTFDARPQPDGALTFDAAPGSPDATAGSPDATVGSPDATVGSPDATVGSPDAAPPPRDGGVIQDAGTAACTQDSQCASGRCHPLYGQCVPQGQRALCEPCTVDSECGMPSDHCLDVSASGMFLERVCAQACNGNADCPRGYECSLAGHCYPIPGTIRVHTCASLRDMLAGEACSSLGADTCGLPAYDDGTCVPTLGCTVGCDSLADCPLGSDCIQFLVANYCVAP